MTFPPKVWESVVHRLAAEFPPFAVDAWVEPLVPEQRAGVLTLLSPNSFHRDRVRDQLLGRIRSLVREELGLNPNDLGSPWGAALSSFAAFATGALVPLAPMALDLENPIPATIALSLVALFAVGCTLSLFTGRNTMWSGARMVLIGGAAGPT